MKCLPLFCLTFFIIFQDISSEPTTLKALAIIHRHGDRSVINPSYPNDPYGNISFWPDGFKQLTIAGKQRLFNLGQFIRTRYSNYLTNDPREVVSRSSGANRCLESAAMLLAAAYPPKGHWNWNSSFPWQPFPIMTRPRSEDGLLNPTCDCPASETERKRAQKLPEYQDFEISNDALFKYLSKHTGENVTSVQTAEYIYDDLHIERSMNYTLPSWVTDDVFTRLKHVADMSFYFEFSTLKLCRLRTGLFFKDLLNYFSASVTDDVSDDIPAPEDDGYSPKKLYHYSSHDTMIAGVLSSLQAFNKLAPPYAASLFFELHRINSSDVVQIFYLNETYSQVLHPITPPGCDKPPSPCSLAAFAAAMQPIIPENWSKECNEDDIFDNNFPGKLSDVPSTSAS